MPYDMIAPNDRPSADERAYETVLGMLRTDLLSDQKQHDLIEAMSPSVQREMVLRMSSLDGSVLLTFKKQLKLVDTVLRRLVSEDGTPMPSAEDCDLSLKDAMAMSLKVTQIMVRELPKVYTIERIQKQEEALRRVMERHLTREQQEDLLRELEEIETASK